MMLNLIPSDMDNYIGFPSKEHQLSRPNANLVQVAAISDFDYCPRRSYQGLEPPGLEPSPS